MLELLHYPPFFNSIDGRIGEFTFNVFVIFIDAPLDDVVAVLRKLVDIAHNDKQASFQTHRLMFEHNTRVLLIMRVSLMQQTGLILISFSITEWLH